MPLTWGCRRCLRLARGLFKLVDLEPLLDRHAKQRASLCIALFIDLRAVPGQDPLGLSLVRRGVGQVQPLARKWIEAGIDVHLERVTPSTDPPLATGLAVRACHHAGESLLLSEVESAKPIRD
jgi:hypothetical protein